MTLVGLLGILSAFAFSSLQPYAQQYRLRAAAINVASELARARQEAIRTRLCHFFVANGSSAFRIVRDDPATPNCQFDVGDPQVRSISFASEFPGITFSSGGVSIDPYGATLTGPTPTNIRFEPRGLVTGNGGSTILIYSTNTAPMAITVTVAGAVRTWTYGDGAWH